MIKNFTDLEVRVREFGRKVSSKESAQQWWSTACWSPSSPSS